MVQLNTDTQTSANPSGVTGTGRLDNSLREALSNMISNISRQDTPFMSSIGTENVSRDTFDWLTDEDNAPVDNAQVEGVQWSSPAASLQQTRTRLYNYAEIATKNIDVSDSAIASDAAGIDSEYKYQMMKRARELKKDQERSMIRHPGNGTTITPGTSTALNNVVKYAFDGTNAAISSSVWTWVENLETIANASAKVIAADTRGTVTVVNAGAATGLSTLNRANGTTVAYDTDSTPADLTRTLVNNILVKIYEAGQGNPSLGTMSPALKVRFSEVYSQGSDTNGADIRRITAAEKMIGTAITKITTDFGFVLGLVPNWLMTDGNGSDGSSILFYEPTHFKTCVFRPYSEKMLGQTGDNTIGMVRAQQGFKSTNGAAHGIVLNVK